MPRINRYPLLLVSVLLVAACSALPDGSDEAAPDRLAFAEPSTTVGDEPAVVEDTRPLDETAMDEASDDVVGDVSVDFAAWQSDGPPSELWLADAAEAATSATQPDAGGAAPATKQPVAAPPQPPVDVMSLYRGVLGTYALDQVLATTTAPMPAVAAGTAPLTGVAPAPAGRPAVVVKIDNSSKARPQSGLNLADIVVEQEVEWGLTRFAAIFHSNRVPVVGPVRSARSTDISFLSSLGRPALVYSGANEVFDRLILQQERVQNFSAARNGAYWRDRSRRAPSNLYTDTRSFDGAGSSPPAWFHYGSTANSGGSAVASVTVSFPSTSVVWDWDGANWLRRQDGKVHTTDGGAQVRTSNVVVAEVPVVDSGLVDPAGSVVPEFIWAGTGRVAVFTNGHRVDGTWVRPTLADPAVLIDGSGNVIELTPGTTWVELVRALP